MYKFNKSVVYKGRATQIAVCLVDDQNLQLPTQGITGSFVRIENEDGSFIEKAASTGIAWGVVEQTFLYIYPFTKEETMLFKKGTDKSLFLKICFGDNCYKYEYKTFLKVFDDIF